MDMLKYNIPMIKENAVEAKVCIRVIKSITWNFYTSKCILNSK